MFRRLKRRFDDMRTLKRLCEEAEQLANADGQQEPGAEHFVLAALNLPDGTARKAFRRLNADPDRFREAIARQYKDALRSIGLDVDRIDSDAGACAVPRQPGLYRSKPSAQTLMQRVSEQRRTGKDGPLLSAHVVAAAAAAEQGVTARALAAMGIRPEALRKAAEAEIGLA